MGQKTPRPRGVGFLAKGRRPAASTRALVPRSERGLLGHCALGAAPAVGAPTPEGAAPAPPLPAYAKEVPGEFPGQVDQPGGWWRKATEGAAGPHSAAPLHSAAVFPRMERLNIYFKKKKISKCLMSAAQTSVVPKS